MRKRSGTILRIAIAALLSVAAMAISSCNSVDDDRIPWAPVRVTFATQGEWTAWGVGGAGECRKFILAERIPAGFPYNTYSATGFGGILLVCDYDGQLRAFDLACPVECRSSVRIEPILNDGTPRGECPMCHSTYDIFRWGGPLGGPAARHGYGLTHYMVAPGLNGESMAITH